MSSAASKLFSTRNLIILSCFIIIAYLLPYFILGENTHIRVHDNLDSNIVWYKILSESGMIFSLPDAPINQIINGLPRSALQSAFDGVLWLYVLFEPFTAYTISQTLMRFVAFFGMYLLLKNHIIIEDKQRVITVGVALSFALLPFWPSGALSIAGLPLALHLFLSIRMLESKSPKRYFLYLFLITFFSSFILTFLFFLSLMGMIWLIDWIRKKQFNPTFFFSIVGMTFIYLIKNYMLIYSMFINSNFVSHRDEMDLGYNDFLETKNLFLENFFESHTHVLDLHNELIFPVVLVAIVIALVKKQKIIPIISFLILNVIFTAIYSLWYWEGTRFLKDNFMIFNTFNFSRIHFLKPLIWYILFALALFIIWKSFKLSRFIIIAILIGQCYLVFVESEEFKYSRANTPTFKEFYATELFSNIDNYIGIDKKKYRVVSVAMHPTIAQYNGFYTLDTYNNTIPIKYKHDFRKIIEPELKKNKHLKTYFDSWGSRLYMFVDQLGERYVFTKNSKDTIKNLNINTKELKKLGGDYLLSGLPIDNYKEIGLKFETSFEHPDTDWIVYLYYVE